MERFNNMSTQDAAIFRDNIQKSRIAETQSGIQTFPEGWSLRVVFNNGNLYHDDIDKSFLIKGCKIVSSQMHVSTSKPGQVSQLYSFLAREVLPQ